MNKVNKYSLATFISLTLSFTTNISPLLSKTHSWEFQNVQQLGRANLAFNAGEITKADSFSQEALVHAKASKDNNLTENILDWRIYFLKDLNAINEIYKLQCKPDMDFNTSSYRTNLKDRFYKLESQKHYNEAGKTLLQLLSIQLNDKKNPDWAKIQCMSQETMAGTRGSKALADSYISLANLLKDSHHYDQAKFFYSQAIKLEPVQLTLRERKLIWQNIGYCAKECNDMENLKLASKKVEEIDSINSKLSEIQKENAIVTKELNTALRQGNLAQVEQKICSQLRLLNSAYKLNPIFPNTHLLNEARLTFNLANAQRRQNKFAQTEETLQQVTAMHKELQSPYMSVDPDIARERLIEDLDALAQIQIQMNKLDEAKKSYMDALSYIAPNDNFLSTATALSHYAQLLQNTENKNEAKKIKALSDEIKERYQKHCGKTN